MCVAVKVQRSGKIGELLAPQFGFFSHRSDIESNYNFKNHL